MRHFFILFILFVGLVYGQYTNTNGKVIDKPFSELLKWRKNSSEPNLSYIETSNEWQQAINSDKDFFIWIGHATFLIKVNNKVILTDPIFSERASPFKRFGPKRLINTPLSVSDIPNVDIVTISHNHYDHLDIPSLKKISKQFKNVSFFVPEGDKRLLIKNNIDNIYDLNWWNEISIGHFKITFTPVQHWSRRGINDKNKSLWGGWYIQTPTYSIYHAGDSGYSNDFKDTQAKLGSPDIAFIPIGAYDPEWFMSESHMNPEEAVQVSIDLNAKKAYGMHWGTFALTDEDTLEPKQRLEEELEKQNLNNFTTLIPGQVVYLN